jgi:hypothetical protein
MEIWYSWLAYIGLIGGLVVAGVLGVSLLRSAVIGFVGGLAIVLVVNFLGSTPPPCLQNAKGWDILRAYSLSCPK